MKYPDLVESIFKTKGVHTDEKEIFLNKQYHTHDPFAFTHMKKIVERIARAIEHKEQIGIYGDFDCDGVPALAILTKALQEYGVDPCVYIPDITKETHGFHIKGVTVLKEKNVSLILVVDCGINDHDTITHAQAQGIDVIILDHHTPKGNSPAFAVFNPMLEKNATPYCGAGCAWKVVSALYTHTRKKEGLEKWLLDLAALSTISDKVPLIKENRIVAHYGLVVLRKTKNKGLRLLLQHLNIQNIDESILEMRVLPFINNTLRMGGAMCIYTLLTSNDEETIQGCIQICDQKNKAFRSAIAKITRSIHSTAKLKKQERNVWVFGNREWAAAFTGIVAQKIATAYNKTIFIWGTNKEGDINGSARTALAQSVLGLLEHTQNLYKIYGGHAFAAGFTAHTHTPLSLEDALNAVPFVEQKEQASNVFSTTLSNIACQKTAQYIGMMAPFGMHNKRPIFEIKAMVSQARVFGKTKKHSAYTLSDGSNTIEVIRLFSKQDIPVGEPIHIQGTLELNTYSNTYILREINVFE